MTQRLLASIAAAELLVTSAIVALGMGALVEPAAGVVTFGVLWYTPVAVQLMRRRS